MQAIMPSIRKVLKGNIKYVHKDEMVNFRTHAYNLIIWDKRFRQPGGKYIINMILDILFHCYNYL